MIETLLIGSGNRHKAIELARMLEGLPWVVKCLADFPKVPEPVEDGDTFQANAVKKALYYGQGFNVCCVADDSGLVVDALRGAPGVLSARYAGEGASDADNNRKLLRELDDVPMSQRTARFVCCAAFADRSGHIHIETGTVEGHIAMEPRGRHGFGYDPLFIPVGGTLTFGEMESAAKDAISHRGRAFKRLHDYLMRRACPAGR